ncbi:MAG: transcription termination/antitermination protein NusG [Chloroflexota bacterium]
MAQQVAEKDKAWYVIHTYSGYEDRVKRNLEQRVKSMDSGNEIFQVVVPTEEEIEVKNGQRHTVVRKILPSYVLVQMKMTDQSWNVVRNTPGVTGFVGSGIKPSPLPEEEVNRILKQMSAESPKIKIGLRQGQSVRVIDGPFVDFMGTVAEVNTEKGKVKVLLTLFSRETSVELDFLQVEKL